MSTDETLTIQITDQCHPDYQCVFWGVRWTDDPAFVTLHNGSYRERLHVSQFRQITEREVEPGEYAATEDIEALLAREGLRRALPQEGSWCIQVGAALVRVYPAHLRPTPVPESTPLSASAVVVSVLNIEPQDGRYALWDDRYFLSRTPREALPARVRDWRGGVTICFVLVEGQELAAWLRERLPGLTVVALPDGTPRRVRPADLWAVAWSGQGPYHRCAVFPVEGCGRHLMTELVDGVCPKCRREQLEQVWRYQRELDALDAAIAEHYQEHPHHGWTVRPERGGEALRQLQERREAVRRALVVARHEAGLPVPVAGAMWLINQAPAGYFG